MSSSIIPLDQHRREFIRKLPKAEQHVHLEGTVAWHIARMVSPEPLPEHPEWLVHDYIFPSFEAFNIPFEPVMKHMLNSVEGYAQVARDYMMRLQAQNVRYVALSFAGLRVFQYELSLQDVVEAIHASTPAGMNVAIYIAFGREQIYTDEQIEAMLSVTNITGIDRHGNELLAQISPFKPIFDEAHSRGLLTKVHAGELLGADVIIEALDTLNVRRIEHGIRAIEDPALMKRLADEQIVLDLCPTSNIRLGVMPSWETYPTRQFIEQGIPITINTDDPGIFNISLTDELERVAYYANLTIDEIAQLQRTAFITASMDNAIRDAILDEIEHLVYKYT